MSESTLYGLTGQQIIALRNAKEGKPIGNPETVRILVTRGFLEEEPERKVTLFGERVLERIDEYFEYFNRLPLGDN